MGFRGSRKAAGLVVFRRVLRTRFTSRASVKRVPRGLLVQRKRVAVDVPAHPLRRWPCAGWDRRSAGVGLWGEQQRAGFAISADGAEES